MREVLNPPFTVALAPGKWDAPTSEWNKRISRGVESGASIVVLTEVTRDVIARGVREGLRPGWRSHREGRPGPSNIMVLFSDRWEVASEPYSIQLDRTQVWSRTGYKRPQTFAVVVPLRDRKTGRVLLVAGTHLPLENTSRRRRQKQEAIEALKAKTFDRARQVHPEAARLLMADWNRRSRLASVRAWFSRLWPGLTPTWHPAARSMAAGSLDWQAGGRRLELVRHEVYRRRRGEALDHGMNLATWRWRDG